MRRFLIACLLTLCLSWVASAAGVLTADVRITVPSDNAKTEVVLVSVDKSGQKEIMRQVYAGGSVVAVNHTWADETAKLQVFLDGKLRYELVPQSGTAPVRVLNAVSNPSEAGVGRTSEDRIAELESRVAALEKTLAALQAK